MFANFTVSGTSLKLMKKGEKGVIARLDGMNPRVADKIKALGLGPGVSLTLEQRSPRFLVRTPQASLALSEPMIQAIYVRIAA